MSIVFEHNPVTDRLILRAALEKKVEEHIGALARDAKRADDRAQRVVTAQSAERRRQLFAAGRRKKR